MGRKKGADQGVRAYCMTLFNYTDLDIEIWETMECQTMLFAKEVTKDGRPHLQGFVYWNAKKTDSACKAMFENDQIHIERKKPWSSFQSNYEYIIGDCFPKKKKHLPPPDNYKPKNEWVFMSGEMPMDQDEKGEANKWDLIKEMHLEDCAEDEFPAWYTVGQRSLYEKNRNHYQSLKKPARLNYNPGLWIYGAKDCGKSEFIRTRWPNNYWKTHDHWWCNYDRNKHDVVWLEEVSPSMSSMATYFKWWGDKGPFAATPKYGNLGEIRPKLIVVTSNYSIDEVFHTPTDRETVHKRFKEIHLTYQFTSDEQKDFEENGVIVDTLTPHLPPYILNLNTL